LQKGQAVSEREDGFWRSSGRVFIGHFVFSSFLGLLTVIILYKVATGLGIKPGLQHQFGIAVVTGLITAVTVWLIHRGKVRRLTPDVFPGDDQSYRRSSAVSAFVCGALVIVAHDSLVGLLVLTGLTFLAIALSIKLFFRRVARLIRPGHYAHIQDVTFLVSVFATLLIAFTLMNFSIDQTYSVMADSPNFDTTADAFKSHNGTLLDHLYFSVVVMTTLGFGDISPILPAAKIAVAMECLMSYVMFALMVGIITRGVIFRGDEENEAGRR
jgi:voltage-gated potassium channel